MALPSKSDVSAMDYAWLGEPAAFLVAMDAAWMGEPFFGVDDPAGGFMRCCWWG
ncbi:MAG: hypothetical protein HQL97_04585 [Magnetococcales bacterium]|nr:hypothetical protein [Magnetococcales bacterium]